MTGNRAVTWDEFTAQIEDFVGGGWLFRGQSQDWPLQTTLERHVPARLSPHVAEQQWMFHFRRRIHEYLSVQQMPSNVGETLALMQHFGAPTRLLDVTRSPYVAAYFAVEDPGDQDRVIYAFHAAELLRRAGHLYIRDGIVTAEDLRKVREKLSLATMTDADNWAGALESQLGAEDWILRVVAVVTPYEPTKLTERLTVQQGQFLVMRDTSKSFIENLAKTTSLEDYRCVYRILLRGNQRERALERLRLMNITRASLFPGLDGFAQSFRQTLIEESPESRIARFNERHPPISGSLNIDLGDATGTGRDPGVVEPTANKKGAGHGGN